MGRPTESILGFFGNLVFAQRQRQTSKRASASRIVRLRAGIESTLDADSPDLHTPPVSNVERSTAIAQEGSRDAIAPAVNLKRVSSHTSSDVRDVDELSPGR